MLRMIFADAVIAAQFHFNEFLQSKRNPHRDPYCEKRCNDAASLRLKTEIYLVMNFVFIENVVEEHIQACNHLVIQSFFLKAFRI